MTETRLSEWSNKDRTLTSIELLPRLSLMENVGKRGRGNGRLWKEELYWERDRAEVTRFRQVFEYAENRVRSAEEELSLRTSDCSDSVEAYLKPGHCGCDEP